MPFEQSKIAIAPAVIMHPNIKNIPKGPMTSKQLKKSYKERNAGPKMTKAEQRKEEQEIREKQRVELEREKRLEKEKRKRDKKKTDEEIAKAERKRLGMPEKSKWVRPSQNKITGFIALGKRNREDDITTDVDMTRENKVIGDMPPPKSKRASVNTGEEVSGYAYQQYNHDIDTAMLNITEPINEDDISTMDSQEDNFERTKHNILSQRKARLQISDDKIEPIIQKLHSSQLAEAPNFGTIGMDESSFMSTGKSKPASQMSAAAPADPFAASQDYLAQCSDVEASPTNTNPFMAYDDPIKPIKAQDISKCAAQKTSVSDHFIPSATYLDLFRPVDTASQPAAHVRDEIHKTFSPLKARPSANTTFSKPANDGRFAASQDYDSYFLTQPPQPPKVKYSAEKKPFNEDFQSKARHQISVGEAELSSIDQFAASQDYDALFATQMPPPLKGPSSTRKVVAKTPVSTKVQPPAKSKCTEPPKNDPFASSQDYDAFFATQASAPLKLQAVTRNETTEDTPRIKQPPVNPIAKETRKNGQSAASQDYDGFFSPCAPHAKPFQKQAPVKIPPPADVRALATAKCNVTKPTNNDQFAASQDYLSMLGVDDSDYDADIQPDLPAPKVTILPENIARHNTYNACQNAKAIAGCGPLKPPSRALLPKITAQPAMAHQTLGRFKLPVTPNNLVQRSQPPRQVQSAAQNTSRPPQPPSGKHHMPSKQASRLVKRTPQAAARPAVQIRTTPPQPTQVLEVGDDFEVQSGTQLMRELADDEELNKKTPQALPSAKEAHKGTINNLSQHLPWLLANGAGPLRQREVLKPVVQNIVRPPSFQQVQQWTTRYPPAQPANTNASRFLLMKPQVATKLASRRPQTNSCFQKPAPRPAPKSEPKPLPSVEIADEMGADDVDIASNSQIMREIQEEEVARSRSATVVPVSRPPLQQKLNSREPTPVYKIFESDSQLMKEMAEEEEQDKKRIASMTPGSQQQTAIALPQPKAASHTKGPVNPVSIHIRSNKLLCDSQIAREMAEEEAMAKRIEQKPADPPKPIIPPHKPESRPQKVPAPDPRISDTPESASCNPTIPEGQWLKKRAATGEFHPLDPAKLARELGQEDAEASKQVKAKAEKRRTGIQSKWGPRMGIFESPFDPTYDCEELYQMGLEEVAKAKAKELVELPIVSDEIPSGSQLMREMAEEEEQERKAKAAETPIATKSDVSPHPKPNNIKLPSGPAEVAGHLRGDWLTNSAVRRNNPGSLSRGRVAKPPPHPPSPHFIHHNPAAAHAESITTHDRHLAGVPPGERHSAAWMSEVTRGRKTPETIASGRAETSPSKHRKLDSKTEGMIAPQIKSFQVGNDEQTAMKMVERKAASQSKPNTPAPISQQCQFSTLKNTSAVAPLASVAAHLPNTPQEPPPSAQPRSTTPLTVRRARKSLYFTEKPEDRAEPVVFDSKIQAARDERRHKEKEAELEVEQKRQDEWLKHLCSTQGLRESLEDERKAKMAAREVEKREESRMTCETRDKA